MESMGFLLSRSCPQSGQEGGGEAGLVLLVETFTSHSLFDFIAPVTGSLVSFFPQQQIFLTRFYFLLDPEQDDTNEKSTKKEAAFGTSKHFRQQSLKSILLCLMKAQKSHLDNNDEENFIFVFEENQTQRALNMPSLEFKDVQVL